MGDMPRYFQEALFEGGAESARQVGEQQVQPAGQLGRSHSADQRARHGHRHAQRRRGARAIGGALHQDVKRWGVLTIGTGLGNARFTNRSTKKDRE
jgi:hypothetical protein